MRLIRRFTDETVTIIFQKCREILQKSNLSYRLFLEVIKTIEIFYIMSILQTEKTIQSLVDGEEDCCLSLKVRVLR